MTKLSEVVKKIESRFGKEAIIKEKADIEFVSSGILSLDLALGGGFPKGRIIEMFGWESSGKSSLALTLAAQIQKEKKAVVYIDMENAIDINYANTLGVDTDSNSDLWFLCQPSSGEEGFEIAREFVQAEEVGLIVFDSVAALLPKALIDGEAGDAKMGLHARLMSANVPKLTGISNKNGCIVLFINQLREKIGVMYGNPQTTNGGNALKFYASQRLEVVRCGQEKDGDEITANKTRVKVVKNKVAPPFKKAEFNINFGTGVDILQDIVDIAVELDIIHKAGSWFSYGETKLGQGSDKVKGILKDNPELLEEIKEKVLIKISEL